MEVERTGLVIPGPGNGDDRESANRDETRAERVDRNLDELLGELRVALPGVQVLFAFLLIVPFNQGFAQVTAFQRGLCFATLLATTAAAALLIAPTVHHRLAFRDGDKEYVVLRANRLAIAGLAVLALAMTGALGLITDVIFGGVPAAIAGSLVGLTFLGLWYGVPMLRMLRGRGRG